MLAMCAEFPFSDLEGTLQAWVCWFVFGFCFFFLLCTLFHQHTSDNQNWCRAEVREIDIIWTLRD